MSYMSDYEKGYRQGIFDGGNYERGHQDGLMEAMKEYSADMDKAYREGFSAGRKFVLDLIHRAMSRISDTASDKEALEELTDIEHELCGELGL